MTYIFLFVTGMEANAEFGVTKAQKKQLYHLKISSSLILTTAPLQTPST